MKLCDECANWDGLRHICNTIPAIKQYGTDGTLTICEGFRKLEEHDPVNSPNHYVGKIECIDYLRDKLTPIEFTGFCIGNVLKYCSRWRKKDGVQDLHKALVYLQWAIENEER